MPDTDTAQWPPPPLRPSVEVLEVGRVRIVRTEDKLTVTNLEAKRVLWRGLLTSVLYAPLMLAITAMITVAGGKAFSDERVRHLFTHTLQNHFLQNEFIAMTLFLVALPLFVYFKLMYRGLFVLDRQHDTFQRGGKDFYPLSELEVVVVQVQPLATRFGKRWVVQLVQKGGDPRPRWRQQMTYPARPDMTLIAACRVREDAEQIAAVIADFTGVPIQRSEK